MYAPHFFFSLENILFLRDEPEVLDATLPVDFVEMGFSIVVPWRTNRNHFRLRTKSDEKQIENN